MFFDVPIHDDLPQTTLTHEERCLTVTEIADKKKVPRDFLNLLVIAEGGKKGQVVANTDGSSDLGPAQVNTIHHEYIERHYPEKSWSDVASNVELNFSISADIFRQCLHHPSVQQNVWEAVGCYNSKTVNIKTRYLYRVMRVWDRIQRSNDLSCRNYWS
ncbi:hypothetical protein [Vibrio chaetopteri]|uniref:Transglycosylase SLT domain-containing protein n=1 Tax=Vibrio chaetopteri TaxID=3016528 RepID=A0AAU8BUH1_9VIBR